MKKLRFYLLPVIINLVFFQMIDAQDEFLHLASNCFNLKSPFSKVSVIDQRPEGQSLGFVQKGAIDRMAFIKYEGSLGDSLGNFFLARNNPDAKEELVFIFHELHLSEKTGAMGVTGRTKLSFRLFLKNEEGKYHNLMDLDSAFLVSGSDVTQKTLTSVTIRMCEMARYAAALIKAGVKSDHAYSYEELFYLDSLEKMQIPVYQAEKVEAGIFKDYPSFKANTPEPAEIIIEKTSNGLVTDVFFINEKGKKEKIKLKEVYAVSDGNVVLKATELGYYELYKKDGDFFYVGNTSFTHESNVATAWAWFGITGAIIAANSDRETRQFILKVNHRKGNSVPIGVANE